MKEFEGKTAVVTGAASGIGRAMCFDLARRGMNVVLADIESGPLETTAAEVGGLGVEALAVVTDVSEIASVKALADAAFDRFGTVHVLANNAGVAIGGALQDAKHEDWAWVIGVNLWGVIHGVEAFVSRMIEQGQGGHIINTSSMAGLIASKGMGIYNTTKYAVLGLSETLAKDLRDFDIGVSVLCPMGVTTQIRASERNRPTELGGGGAPRDHGGPDLVGRYLSTETVSAMVMNAIENNILHIPTHFEGKEFWDRRAQRISESFPPAE